MYYEAPNMIKLEIFILLAFPLKRRERKKNTKKLHSMYSSATALQFSYQSQQIRKLIVLCKWNLRKTKKRKKGKKRKQNGYVHISWVGCFQVSTARTVFWSETHIPHICTYPYPYPYLSLSLLFLLKATLTYWERVALGMEGLDTQFSV